MEEISETGTTENSSVSKQAARNRKVIKYRKRTYLFHLPNHNSGLSLAVNSSQCGCKTVLPELSVWIVPRTVRVLTLLPLETDTEERLQ